MKFLFSSVALSALAIIAVASPQSPKATETVKVGGKSITITYFAPSVRGRQIFGDGGLISKDPNYPVWRAGADFATVIDTEADLQIGTVSVPKGTYSLYVDVKDPNNWQLIVNKKTGQWGLDYPQADNLGQVKMTMTKPTSPVEVLKYTLSSEGANKAKLQLAWENHVASVSVSVK
jgi:hypothetical protein